MSPFILVSPATRGLSLALVRHYLRTTSLPVFGTYRPTPTSSSSSSEPPRTPDSVREHILRPLQAAGHDVDPARLRVLPLDLMSEDSIAAAADELARTLLELYGSDAQPYVRIAFFLGGMLYPERQPGELVLEQLLDTFRLNTVSHLLLIKHFSRFLPHNASRSQEQEQESKDANTAGASLAKWVHLSARVGSVSDNQLGGWYSYRASKAALNQIIRTFDLHLQAKKLPAICVGVHPGTVKTNFSKAFWKGVPAGKLFEPEFAAAKLAEVVQRLGAAQRGRVWDWKGEEVKP
ncbi:NAD(P)-binding protein [Polyporus arcularius HHB13444]|uniref:NAD(P)-binding protein n=1 Tax=Polyporus arcularius HHB13444 TaxID=1314778 RepID=A0A5C3PN26_9APHY|nr:NAD(P)-binding protein [Polyporus arcularius HHB13444]